MSNVSGMGKKTGERNVPSGQLAKAFPSVNVPKVAAISGNSPGKNTQGPTLKHSTGK